jgi:His-Xaa-Ser system radical SAM maturase HxsC
MCPDADVVRKVTFNANIDELVEQIKNTPNDTVHLTITGGEPGLLKDGLIDVIKACKEYLPSTEFTLLSNGRVFSNTEFVNKFKENIPNNIKIAIPLYSDNNELHDSITRAKGSFKQTVCGIKKLLKRNIDVEIRIVVLKKNYKILPDIAKFISNEFSNVKLVNIMALEMTGNAFENRNDVWINFESIKEYVYQSCITFIKSGILVNLYNFPLCCIDKRLYSIANKSISDYKIRYKEECEKCKVKENCGGFFSSTINMKDIKINPIL